MAAVHFERCLLLRCKRSRTRDRRDGRRQTGQVVSGAQLGYASRGPGDGRLRAGIRTPGRHRGQYRPLVAGKDRGCDPADSLRLADSLDLDDLAIGDREGKDGVWPPADGDHPADRAIDKYGVHLRTERFAR